MCARKNVQKGEKVDEERQKAEGGGMAKTRWEGEKDPRLGEEGTRSLQRARGRSPCL